MNRSILFLIIAFGCVLGVGAKERTYQTASVLSGESRKVGERERGITAHRVTEIKAMVYRIQVGSTVYEIQPAGHDPLGATAVGQNIEISIEKSNAYVRATEGKKQKEYTFKIVGAYPAKSN